MAPTTSSPTMSGIPPCSGVKSGSATMAVRPFLMISSNVRVGFLKSAAVRALPTEMVAPAANVPSSRSSTMRLPPSSTTAMAPPGALSRRASPIAVATTCRAPSSVSAFFSATCASTAPVIATMSAATAKPMSFFMALPRTDWPPPAAPALPARRVGGSSVTYVLARLPGHRDRSGERRLAENDLGPRAPHLHLGDVRDVRRQRDRRVDLVVLQLQPVEQVHRALRVDDLPVRIRRAWHREVRRQAEDVLAATVLVSHRAAGHGLAGERRGDVGGEADGRVQQRDGDCEQEHHTTHIQSPCVGTPVRGGRGGRAVSASARVRHLPLGWKQNGGGEIRGRSTAGPCGGSAARAAPCVPGAVAISPRPPSRR